MVPKNPYGKELFFSNFSILLSIPWLEFRVSRECLRLGKFYKKSKIIFFFFKPIQKFYSEKKFVYIHIRRSRGHTFWDDVNPTPFVKCLMSHVTCHMSHIMCHMPPVTCQMSCVTCHLFTKWWSQLLNRLLSIGPTQTF